MDDAYDAIIVGGGPAGLSAALVLGRCRRRVLVFDRGEPRNARARASHGFFTRDGASPEELRRIGRAQLAPYGVEVRDVEVRGVRRLEGGFEVTTAEGGRARARKLLLATGMRDHTPALPGLEPLLGTSVLQCPYCDGWECAAGPVAAYARGRAAVEFALGLQTWSEDVSLFTDGAEPLGERERAELERHRVSLHEGEIAALEGEGGRLERVVLRDGRAVACRALFVHLGQEQAAPFAAELGCEFEPNGTVKTGACEATGVPGLFVAGDASHDVQWLVVAAAEGAKAAHAINGELRREACARAESRPESERAATMMQEVKTMQGGGRLGGELVAGGVAFRAWSTKARAMAVALFDAAGERVEREVPLEARGGGRFEAVVPGLGAGTLYKFRVDDALFPDPYARALPFGVHGPAEVTDPGAYEWRRPPRREPLSGRTVVYELHVGTFTPEGTFAAARARLSDLAALGVTTVELMPLSSFAGRRGWGYDGVAHFAPHAAYGPPDELKAFVDEAHGLGLSVWLDVVYNHFGPEGNYLGAYSPEYFSPRAPTPWGDGPDYGEPHMRAYLLDNATYWLDEFRLDGLRLDATHHVLDANPKHVLRELAERVRALGGPPPVLVAEDERNDPGLVTETGLDGVWADDAHHALHVLLTGEREGYYAGYAPRAATLARAIERGWLYEGQPWPATGRPRGRPADALAAPQFVYALQNHDQVGNRARGERLHHLVSPEAWRGASALLLFLPMTPLLFMGQEWACSSPFQYFTDFPAELGRLVSEGRRREFEGFVAFSSAASRDAIPDPQAEATFAASKLAWAERDEAAHRETLALYTELLHLRARDPVLADASRERLRVGVEGGLLWVWRWGAGGGHRALVWNVGEREAAFDRPPLPSSYEWSTLLRSERAGRPGLLARFEAVVLTAEGPPPG